MKYLLGIDFGGGASKATLLSEEGNIVAESTYEYPTYHDEVGACEQSADDWIVALCENTHAILEESGISAEDIVAVAPDSATHSFLLCDGDFKPLGNAVHWTDTRSRKQAAALDAEAGDFIYEKTFHRPSTIWTLPQLIWYKEAFPERFARAKYLFFEKDYVRHFLTGVFCTDYIEAEGSMLFDCQKLSWSDELCAMGGIDCEILPPIVNPTDIIGKITEQAAEATGLAAGTPVVCGTTDTVMEIFASGAVKRGDITVKIATAGRICVITDKPYPDKHIINYSHIADGLWYPGTATKAAASSYRWYRDTFGEDYKTLDAGAEQIPIGSEGLIFHPYINGELTPYANPLLCGSYVGVRATHTKAHFTRATLEGVVMSLLDCKKYLDTLNIEYNSAAVAIGGGTKGKLWRQMLSDALGITLKTAKNSDSSFGSAMLAGIAVGVFKNPEDAVAKCVSIKDVTYPNMENHEKYQKLYEEYKKVSAALEPIYNARA